jgi:DNA-binding IscR family transcriptional regulator
LRRQGAWNESLANFASVARQINLTDLIQETSEQQQQATLS